MKEILVMKMKNERTKVKFFKKPAIKSISSSLLAILLGVIVGFIIMIISNPGSSLAGLGKMFMGSFSHPQGGMQGIGQLLYRATPLIFTGLAVGFSFKTGLFNIGASGQYMVGIFAALIVAITGDSLGVMRWPLALLAGALAGAIWGSIPGLFKAFLNVNEVITSIMFNHIAVHFINGMLRNVLSSQLVNPATNRSLPIPQGARTPYVGLDKIFPNTGLDFGIILAVISCIVIYIILTKTVFGKELIAVGSNRHAAKYAGVNEKKSIILAMTISGMLAGIGGALFILAPSVRGLGNNYSVENVILPAGFDGITIALLANSNPLGIFVSAIFIQYIKLGGQYMQSLGFKPEIVEVIVGIILYFSAFSLIVGKYFAKIFKRKKGNDDETINSEQLLKSSDDLEPKDHLSDSVTTELGGDQL